MPCMVRVERRGKSPPVPQVTGGSCKLYPKQHRKENSAPGRRAGPVRFREVARGVWQQASQIDGCIDRTRLIGLLEKRRHPQWLPSFSVLADRYRAARSGPGDSITPPGCLDRAGQHHLIAPAPDSPDTTRPTAYANRGRAAHRSAALRKQQQRPLPEQRTTADPEKPERQRSMTAQALGLCSGPLPCIIK